MSKIYLCVLDFEATCQKNVEMKNREIIEFPSILYCIDDGKISQISQFQEYVQPTINPKLTAFCTELTGITQSQTDNAETLPIVYKKHFAWLEPQIRGHECYFVTCGNWDLQTQLPTEATQKKIKIHKMYQQFINIKDMFYTTYGTKAKSLSDMLNQLKLPLVGRQHSGLDDCINIGNVLCRLIHNGYKCPYLKSQ